MCHSDVEQTGTERIILLYPGHRNKDWHKPPLSIRMKFLFESTVLNQNLMIDLFMAWNNKINSDVLHVSPCVRNTNIWNLTVRPSSWASYELSWLGRHSVAPLLLPTRWLLLWASESLIYASASALHVCHRRVNLLRLSNHWETWASRFVDLVHCLQPSISHQCVQSMPTGFIQTGNPVSRFNSWGKPTGCSNKLQDSILQTVYSYFWAVQIFIENGYTTVCNFLNVFRVAVEVTFFGRCTSHLHSYLYLKF